MKYRLFCLMIGCFLLISAVLTACQDSGSTSETGTDPSGDITAAQPIGSEPEEGESTPAECDTTEAGTTYPHDGESNPDWPYSPGV